MNQEKKGVLFSPDTVIESKTSALNRQSRPRYQLKVTKREAAPEVLPILDESETDSAEVNPQSNVLPIADQRTAVDDKLVDKVENGSLFLQLKMLHKVLPSLAHKIGLESLLKELQSMLNVDELTEDCSRPSQANKFREPLQHETWSRKAEKIEESNQNENAIRLSLNKLDHMVKEAPAKGLLLSRLVDLNKVIKALIRFCKNIFKTLEIIDDYPPGTDEFFEIAAFSIKKLISLKSYLPEYLKERYSCAKVFQQFSTGLYVERFSNLVEKDMSDEESHLCRNIVKHLPDFARWLKLYIQVLVEFGNALSYSKLTTWYGHTEKSPSETGDILHEQKEMFWRFSSSSLPFKSQDFAYEFFNILDHFIEDVGSEVSEMSDYLCEKLDFGRENLL